MIKVSKAVGGKKAMCCFSQLFACAMEKEGKGFLFFFFGLRNDFSKVNRL